MRFVTVITSDKLDEIINIGELKDNSLFRLSDVHKESICIMLEDLNGVITNPIIGAYVGENEGDLSSLWNELSKTLPIKAGDLIMQFKIEEDECLYCDFNELMSVLYFGNDNLGEKIHFIPSTDDLAITNSIKAENFDYAFIVRSDWKKGNVNTVNKSNMIMSFQDLHGSKIWRN